MEKSMRSRKVVIDTSVIVAGLFKSRSNEILSELAEGRFVACYSPAILNEYTRILLKIPPIRLIAKAWLDELHESPYSRLYENPPRLNVAIDDPDDRKFLECASEAKADFLISLDDHLLRLGTHDGTAILRPGEFLDALKQSGASKEPSDCFLRRTLKRAAEFFRFKKSFE